VTTFLGDNIEIVVTEVGVTLCANIGETTTSSLIRVEGEEVIKDERTWKSAWNPAAAWRVGA
jgi:hypothetical protein